MKFLLLILLATGAAVVLFINHSKKNSSRVARRYEPLVGASAPPVVEREQWNKLDDVPVSVGTSEADDRVPVDVRTSYVRRERLLSKPEALLYLILKTGLPEHNVFANVRMADLVDVHRQHKGFERLRRFRKISQYHLDFVVCDKQMHMIAAIELDDSSHDHTDRAQADRLKDDCLEAVGLKMIRFRVGKIPKHQEIREIVLKAA